MNFQKQQEIECTEHYMRYFPLSSNIELIVGYRYTVRLRMIIDGVNHVSLMQFKPDIYFRSGLFAAYDMTTCPSGMKTHTFTVHVDNPEYDKYLKDKWNKSVEDEEYEKSQIYWDEMKERKIEI